MSRPHQAPGGKRLAAVPMKSNTFFGGAAILALGILATKVIGALYKIPLYNIIGPQGAADFNNAYNIYAVLLTISTTGLPVAVSKLVSEANALGRRNQVRRVFRTALLVFLLLGGVSFAAMFFWSDGLAALMKDTLAAPSIRALAPAVVCVGCLSAFRGYFQGHQNMTPTAVSQVLEAGTKLVLGLSLAAMVMGMTFTAADLARHRPELELTGMTQQELAQAAEATQTSLAAAGAITGVTVGTIFALVFLVVRFLLVRQGGELGAGDRPEGRRKIMVTLLQLAIPITLSSSVVGIVTIIDAILVQGQLQNLYLSAQGITQPTAEVLEQLRVPMEAYSRNLYGNYAGALNLYNLPLSLIAAITASVIPAVSACRARHDHRGAGRIAGSALRVSALMVFPMGVGFLVLGQPIVALILPGLDASVAGPLLSPLGLASIFVSLMLVCNSILQAHGFVNLPIAILLLGGVVKIITNYNLVAIESIGIRGAPIGNVLCFGLCLGLDLLLIHRVIPNRPKYLPLFAKPALAAGLMGLAVWAIYGLSTKALLASGLLVQVTQEGAALSRMGSSLCTLLAIGAGAALYLVLVVVLRAISREDLTLMPKGEKLARLLRL